MKISLGSSFTLALVHYVVGVAVLGCLLGFGVITGPAGTDLTNGLLLLIGAGVGGGLVAFNPNTTTTTTPTTTTAPVVAAPVPAAPVPAPAAVVAAVPQAQVS